MDVKLIEIKEEIHAENSREADAVRAELETTGTFLLNLMSSPGSGKTSVILKTAEALGDAVRMCVVEADLDSKVDAEKVAAAGIPSLQIKTGGFCHVDAFMMRKGLAEVDLTMTDLVVLENVGNLVCPAQCDTGAALNVVILSVPEGDDKPLKYPLIFKECDALIVNKTDYFAVADFDMAALSERIKVLNPSMPIFPVSCKTGDGIGEWVAWLKGKLSA